MERRSDKRENLEGAAGEASQFFEELSNIDEEEIDIPCYVRYRLQQEETSEEINLDSVTNVESDLSIICSDIDIAAELPKPLQNEELIKILASDDQQQATGSTTRERLLTISQRGEFLIKGDRALAEQLHMFDDEDMRSALRRLNLISGDTPENGRADLNSAGDGVDLLPFSEKLEHEEIPPLALEMEESPREAESITILKAVSVHSDIRALGDKVDQELETEPSEVVMFRNEKQPGEELKLDLAQIKFTVSQGIQCDPDLDDELPMTVSDLKMKINELRQEICRLNLEVQTKDKAVLKTSNEKVQMIRHYQSRFTTSEIALTDVENCYRKVCEELVSLEEEHATLKDEYTEYKESLEAQVVELKDELKEKSSKVEAYEKLKTAYVQMEAEMNTVKVRDVDLMFTVESLVKEKTKLKDYMKRDESLLAAFVLKCSSLKKQHDEMKTAHALTNKELEECKRSILAMKETEKVHIAYIQNLKEKLDTKPSEPFKRSYEEGSGEDLGVPGRSGSKELKPAKSSSSKLRPKKKHSHK